MYLKNKEKLLQYKREKKRFKRKKKLKKRSRINSPKNTFWLKKTVEAKRETYLSPLYKFLRKKEFYSKNPRLLTSNILSVPRILSFEVNNKGTIDFLKLLISKLHPEVLNPSPLELSFQNCERLDLGALMVLNVFIQDFFKYRRRLLHSFKNRIKVREIVFNENMNPQINNLLFTMHFNVKINDEINGRVPIMGFRLIEGNKKLKNYAENSKGKICFAIRKYINLCLNRHGVELNPFGVNKFDNLIGEILNNAEDHSKIDNWYVYGSLMENSNDNDTLRTSELNLVFLNFGDSIYEGFENTRKENFKTFNEMNKLYQSLTHSPKLNKLYRRFSKENLFTLFGLQEGYSRLKFESESRGTGTMSFIRAFIDLGDYCYHSYKPGLFILSGHTLVKCDQKYKPFQRGERYFLSLNDEQDLTKPPSKNHLLNLEEYFPGTVLLTKIYLNKNHFMTKL